MPPNVDGIAGSSDTYTFDEYYEAVNHESMLSGREDPPFAFVNMHDIIPMNIAHGLHEDTGEMQGSTFHEMQTERGTAPFERLAGDNTQVMAAPSDNSRLQQLPSLTAPIASLMTSAPFHIPISPRYNHSCPPTPGSQPNTLSLQFHHSAPASTTSQLMTPPPTEYIASFTNSSHPSIAYPPAHFVGSLPPYQYIQAYPSLAPWPLHRTFHHSTFTPVASQDEAIHHGLPSTYSAHDQIHDVNDQHNNTEFHRNSGDPTGSCWCGQPDTTKMVTCSHARHNGPGKYHPLCLGMLSAPVERSWTCDNCKEQNSTGHSNSTISEDSEGHDELQVVPAHVSRSRGRRVSNAPPVTAWTDVEDALAIKLMKEIKGQTKFRRIDQLWEEISLRMQGHGYSRTAGAVKNQWNRRLRSKSGFDERVTPRPDLMRTGLLLAKGVTVTKSQRLTKQSRPAKKHTPSYVHRRQSKATSTAKASTLPPRRGGPDAAAGANSTSQHTFDGDEDTTSDEDIIMTVLDAEPSGETNVDAAEVGDEGLEDGMD